MEADQRPIAITKVLTANDTGDTGAHQAGILVPKTPRILMFFPELNPAERNPRRHLVFQDDDGKPWEFAFIYYNNRLFGGTRDEYRLTRMTRFLRWRNLKPGDTLTLRRLAEFDEFLISYRRASQLEWTASGALKLGSTWKEIKY